MYLPAGNADFLNDQDRVLGVVIEGQAHAYPIGIMTFHEIVNHQGDDGHRRDYQRSPYGDYDTSAAIFFPVAERDERYHPKAWTVGLEVVGVARAWPFEELEKSAERVIQDSFNGMEVEIHFNPEARSAQVFSADGQELAATTAFWFAWYAFHPHTTVYSTD